MRSRRKLRGGSDRVWDAGRGEIGGAAGVKWPRERVYKIVRDMWFTVSRNAI